MEITEVKVILKEGPDKKLKAYATITLDNCFVVRNIKIIKGTKGLFVAMPSRKMKESCPKCRYKNAMRSRFCNQCGAPLPVAPSAPPAANTQSPDMRQSEHRDIAHPITLECREYIQKKVLEEYEAEVRKGGAEQRTGFGESRYAEPRTNAPSGERYLRDEDESEGDIEL